MSIMSDSKIEILDAAMRVIMRFGLRKTTMKDIADEAGVARQTVYNAFHNKDELLCDLIRHAGGQMEQQTRADWQRLPTLKERLEVFYEHALLIGFRTLRAEGASVEDSLSAAGHVAIAEVDQIKDALLRDLFADHAEALARQGCTVDQMADWVRYTCVGYKHQARDEAHLMALLGLMTQMVLNLCEQPG
ncbi:Fatty acid metabolism regulator protein [Thalassovita mediterranea]|jgi:AcrR family transcriptional regulator|uniref:Fatty acid metabolism regulator protein n=2 Tax=Thalassovita mediterranea TaxID=340021 RepID=A0A0P1GT02_9RHOB|nr:Fatty acid metabolism regulator protein [Thalassovita mediterranea]SIS32792.1 transcriptional regulator, TetR family [Thalassovita mediterranea]